MSSEAKRIEWQSTYDACIGNGRSPGFANWLADTCVYGPREDGPIPEEIRAELNKALVDGLIAEAIDDGLLVRTEKGYIHRDDHEDLKKKTGGTT